MPLGMEVGLCPGDFVLDGIQPPTPKGTQLLPEKGHTNRTQFLAHVYCCQMAGWMKTPLGTEVDLVPGHFAVDGIPAPAKGAQQPPLFGPCHCGHGRPSQLLLSFCYISLSVKKFYMRL